MRVLRQLIAIAMLCLWQASAGVQASAQPDAPINLADYAERSIRVVETARLHFQIADKLREVTASAMAPASKFPDVFAAGFDVRDGIVDKAELDTAVAEYKDYVTEISASLSKDLGVVQRLKLQLPRTRQAAVDALSGEAQEVYQTIIDRSDQIVSDVVAFANGADNYLATDDGQSAELRALIVPLLNDTLIFAERSFDYEIEAIKVFVPEGLGVPTYLGLSWDYLHHMRHAAKWTSTLVERVEQLQCTKTRIRPDIAPMEQALDALDKVFQSPEDIEKTTSGAVFLLLLQAASPEQLANGGLAAQGDLNDAIGALVDFETNWLASTDAVLELLNEEGFATCESAEEVAPLLTADLQVLLTSVSYHPVRRSLRSTQYAVALNHYQVLATSSSDGD